MPLGSWKGPAPGGRRQSGARQRSRTVDCHPLPYEPRFSLTTDLHLPLTATPLWSLGGARPRHCPSRHGWTRKALGYTVMLRMCGRARLRHEANRGAVGGGVGDSEGSWKTDPHRLQGPFLPARYDHLVETRQAWPDLHFVGVARR